MTFQLDPTTTLPTDGTSGTLLGRVWRPDVEGPSVIALRPDGCYDVSHAFPTVRDLCEARNPAAAIAVAKGERIGDIKSILANTPEHSRDPSKAYLLTPIDLQAVKAAGVTFATSLLERVIEEQARGEPQRAAAVRVEVEAAIAGAVGSLKPGSPEAAALKQLLIAKGMWSQYLEVGIGSEAETSQSRSQCPVLVQARRSGFFVRPFGTIPSQRLSLWSIHAAKSSARRSVTMSICAILKAALPCCSARQRTTTPRRRSDRSCVSSIGPFRSTMCARPR
jgi:hypothetical protein